MKAAQQILQHEASGAGAGIHRSEDEKRLEQNCEVIPEGHHCPASGKFRQDLRHAHRQGRRAAGTGNDGMFPHVLRRLGDHLGREIKAPLRDGFAQPIPQWCR